MPPPVCRDGDACGMKVPAVKQRRIAAEDVLLPSLPPDVGTRWSVSPTCALPVWLLDEGMHALAILTTSLHSERKHGAKVNDGNVKGKRLIFESRVVFEGCPRLRCYVHT